VAVTYEAFLARYPHFKPGGNAQQQAATQLTIEKELALAAREVNLNVWGDHADNAIMLLAAHRVSINPGGQFARYASKDGSSNYLKEYERMLDQLLIGDRVI
jgi:hypothetical protein